MHEDQEKLLGGLDRFQREAVTSLDGPVRIIAGAGAGKTRTITHRIAYACAQGSWDPSKTMAVTFSVKAAAEMRSRLTALGVPESVKAATFHSAAFQQLRQVWPQVSSSYPPTLIQDLRPLVKAAYKRVCGQEEADPGQVRDLEAEINWAKVGLIAPKEYVRVCAVTHRTPPAGLDPDRMADLYEAFEYDKSAHNQMDFNDILLLVCHILEEEPEAAAVIRSRIRWMTVDEYQDVSPLQHRLLRLWLDDRDNLCVVGDPAQTIYSFAGATSYYLLDFPEEYPSMKADLQLNTDYRSTPQVVNYANRVLSKSPNRGDYLKLKSNREAGKRIGTTRYQDDVEEAHGVAKRIERLIHGGADPGQCAVLTRINAQQPVICAALHERGIPYRLRTDSGWLDQSVSEVTAVQSSEKTVEDLQQARARGQVTVSTIHAAKGLEFGHVFLVGCSEGLLPFGSPREGEDLEEERRLMYVAVTRAEDTLHLSFAEKKDPASFARRTPSRFVQG